MTNMIDLIAKYCNFGDSETGKELATNILEFSAHPIQISPDHLECSYLCNGQILFPFVSDCGRCNKCNKKWTYCRKCSDQHSFYIGSFCEVCKTPCKKIKVRFARLLICEYPLPHSLRKYKNKSFMN
jgi:hypothetical protein